MNMQDAAQVIQNEYRFELNIWLTDFALWLTGSLVSNKFLDQMYETGRRIL